MCSGWHEVDNWPLVCYVISERAQSDTFSVPYFISDSIEPCTSMADGRVYSSKAALRATYKASGNPQGESYVEVGNAPIREAPAPDVKQHKSSVRESLQKAKSMVGL